MTLKYQPFVFYRNQIENFEKEKMNSTAWKNNNNVKVVYKKVLKTELSDVILIEDVLKFHCLY